MMNIGKTVVISVGMLENGTEKADVILRDLTNAVFAL
jgi:hypothetical protein